MYTHIQKSKPSHNHSLRARARFRSPFLCPAGFSLIEIIMILLIIGILAGIAIPRFAAFFVVKLEGGRKKIIYDIRYVQQMAVARHTNTRIVFNVGTETYSAQEWKESSPGSGTWAWSNISSPFTRYPLSVDFRSDVQYHGIDIRSASFNGSGTLQFDWKGTPTNGGIVQLFFKGESLCITVESNTGFVRPTVCL
jgi:Tfp pilus assembly protein FimT